MIDESNMSTKREGPSETQHRVRIAEIVNKNLPSSKKKQNADLPLNLEQTKKIERLINT